MKAHGLSDLVVLATVRNSALCTLHPLFSFLRLTSAFQYIGIIGSCEDQDDDEIQDQFDTNLIGLINIIQLTLPYFRERRSGRYIIFSSICGLIGVPGLGREFLYINSP